jgi:hypothetical protein
MNSVLSVLFAFGLNDQIVQFTHQNCDNFLIVSISFIK